MQAGSRRLSARLQEKDEAHIKDKDARFDSAVPGETIKNLTSGQRGSQKRKNDYDEDDDGFTFSRVNKNKRPRQAQPATKTATSMVSESTDAVVPGPRKSTSRKVLEREPSQPGDNLEPSDMSQKKRKRMSFSTPKAKESQPTRRSKRLSNEVAKPNDSPLPTMAPPEVKSRKREQPKPETVKVQKASDTRPGETVDRDDIQVQQSQDTSECGHAGTKISLPFADTPIIKRNKAMREGKGAKGDRRSSLGLRGRRASSLIDTGSSNALPHQEVDIPDFYKHIESDLMEPRRMKQLLTWCGTRAMHAKPKGTDFEDASAKSAARVIEEELLKELASKSELSDWFSREDVPEAPKPLPERPNPKNVQNLQKVAELEDQINRLKLEKEALQSLLQPPEISEVTDDDDHTPVATEIDSALLSEEDATILKALASTTEQSTELSRRINSISSGLGPSIDSFADAIHKVAQYRTATDMVAGRILSICANRIAERERDGRRKALHVEEDRSPGRDLSNVLRGLSKAER